jgi:hypothetical protein
MNNCLKEEDLRHFLAAVSQSIDTAEKCGCVTKGAVRYEMEGTLIKLSTQQGNVFSSALTNICSIFNDHYKYNYLYFLTSNIKKEITTCPNLFKPFEKFIDFVEKNYPAQDG